MAASEGGSKHMFKIKKSGQNLLKVKQNILGELSQQKRNPTDFSISLDKNSSSS